MSTIPAAVLPALRQRVAHKLGLSGEAIDYVKAEADAVFQAIEDFEVAAHTTRPSAPNPTTRRQAITDAAGRQLTAAQEAAFWAVWATWKIRDLGV